MADITYTVSQDDPNNIPGFENYSQSDRNLLSEYQINNLFDSTKHFIELYITDLNGEIIEADSSYTGYKLLGNAQSAGREGASTLTINPVEDSKIYGYGNGGVKLLYHFLNDLYTQDKLTTEFFITDISPDRTELQLQNLNLPNEELISYTSAITDKLSSQSYFNEFRLDFGDNDLLIGINIDTLLVGENQTVVVKLYEPLPIIYTEKSTLNIVEIISDSIAFEVDATYSLPEIPTNTLRPANFNLDITDSSVVPTGYLDYNDLFSYPVSNQNNQLYSLISEKGVELSIDHTDYSDFVHFSSAYERLVNFKYKVQLIENYNANLPLIQSATSQSAGTTGSIRYYENLITGIVNNFDHYERYLYYESSSTAWPKSNTTQPYNNYNTTSSQAINWYANQLATANGYDLSNGNLLINSIPSFLRDDPNNENYLTFIHMIGQHFDNLWIYGKAVTDKYDADNRLNFGISKDLVGEALKNFGVKLYTSNNSIEDLFGSFIGQAYQSGSEVINHYITGSLTGSNTPIQPSSYDNYNKEVQKRIYHNLSHLVKTKGTERGLRALINCFGIPSDILKIKQYGGRNTDERPFFGDYQAYTSSLSKIRLDNTGSITSGNTLSNYTSIIKRNDKYTDDLHAIEVGFSPVDNIDNYILSHITASFDIDDYIGDPGDLTSENYSGLTAVAQLALSGSQVSGSYDYQDYVRLIKFYDNTIFKMIKDFIPARVVADTGIIIKPNLLNRSKAKSIAISGSRPELSGSIDTAFIGGNNAGVFEISTGESSTSYPDVIQTPDGLVTGEFLHNQEQPKYNGEFSGSNIVVTRGNLTVNNPYLIPNNATYNFGTIQYVSSSTSVCLLEPYTNIQYVTSSTQNFEPLSFFNIGTSAVAANNSNFTYTIISASITVPATPQFNFGNYSQYSQLTITATDITKTVPCTKSTSFIYGTCSIMLNTNIPSFVGNVNPVNLTNWFTVNTLQASSVQYTASWDNGTNTVGIPNPSSYLFTQPEGTEVTITVRDPKLGDICKTTQNVFVGSLNIIPILPPTTQNGRGYEFLFSYRIPGPTTETANDTGFSQSSECYADESGICHNNLNDYEFLGHPARGIPGYFTTLGQTEFQANLLPGGIQAPNIRYRIFAVTGNTGPNAYTTTGVPYIVTPVRDLSPYANALEDNPLTWIDADAFQDTSSLYYKFTNTQMINRVFINQQKPPYTQVTGFTDTDDIRRGIFNLLYQENESLWNQNLLNQLTTGRWPITIHTPPYNYPQVDNNNNWTSVTEPKVTLVRAYIIQAYVPDIESNPQYDGTMRQVVVYAERGSNVNWRGIYNIENDDYSTNTTGPPKTYPHYEDQYLLVGQDYANVGLPQEPGLNFQTSITEQPTSINHNNGSTWVKFPRRYFTANP